MLLNFKKSYLKKHAFVLVFVMSYRIRTQTASALCALCQRNQFLFENHHGVLAWKPTECFAVLVGVVYCTRRIALWQVARWHHQMQISLCSWVANSTRLPCYGGIIGPTSVITSIEHFKTTVSYFIAQSIPRTSFNQHVSRLFANFNAGLALSQKLQTWKRSNSYNNDHH